MRAIGTIFLGLALILAAGCDDEDGANEPIVGDGNVFEVQIEGDMFTPRELTIPVGATVRWVNGDSEDHTVTSGTGAADPGAGASFDRTLGPGETFEVTFDSSGEQPYFCRIHEALGMTGRITVKALERVPPRF